MYRSVLLLVVILRESASTWQIHPTLIGTFPIVDKLELNPSFKVLVPFEEDLETTIAVNLGLGINIFKGFTLRPEYAYALQPWRKRTF